MRGGVRQICQVPEGEEAACQDVTIPAVCRETDSIGGVLGLSMMGSRQVSFAHPTKTLGI
jgi:hypothetical protein